MKNLQGDIIAVADASNTVVARYTYDAWGVCTVTDAEGNENTISSFIGNINPYRYRCYYYDTETELYYLQSRYYDAEVGRFVNADEVEVLEIGNTVKTGNIFVYCNNNPIKYADFNGTFALVVAGVTFCFSTAIALFALTSFALFYTFDRNFRKAFNQTIAILSETVVDGWGYLINVISEIVEKAKASKRYSSQENHHIVAQNDERAELSKELLEYVGLQTSSPYNIVRINNTLHRHIHTNAYHMAVFLVLRICIANKITKVQKKYAVISGLIIIGAIIKQASNIF